MVSKEVPKVKFAVIGGSSTFSINFPRDLNRGDVCVGKEVMKFNTPYGESPPFTLFSLGERTVLTCRMHGWRRGVARADASRQVFWVLREAGIKIIMSEGGVGSINRLLRPGDLIVPSDYLDFSMRKDVGLDGEFMLSMRQAVCPQITKQIVCAAEDGRLGRVFDRGVYAVTDGRHFESPAEVEMLHRLGADIVGQSMCPEVYLAREIGACYGRLDIVVNYAEGVVKEWDYNEFTRIFYDEAACLGNILLNALKDLEIQHCTCQDLRKPSLIKEKS